MKKYYNLYILCSQSKLNHFLVAYWVVVVERNLLQVYSLGPELLPEASIHDCN